MPSGRVRQFDADDALDRAMAVFWHRGYEGTTLDELTAAMGINRPSLYAAFGNKEELFRKVLDRYRAGPIAFVRAALAEPTARSVMTGLLSGIIELSVNQGHPRGCMVVQAALACGAAAEPIRRELAAVRERAVQLIRERFERAVAEDDLPRATDCVGLARFAGVVMHGLAVQAASGATPDELRRAAGIAMIAWPC